MTTNARFAPYAAPENVLRVLRTVSKIGTKGKIDADFLRQLDLNEGMIARTLRALEYLGFIDGDGTPTALLERLKVTATDEEWQSVLQDSLRSAYGTVFRAVNPTTDSRNKVFASFKPMEPNKQWGRMTTLFRGLCDAAGIAVKEPPVNRAGKGASKPKERSNGRVPRHGNIIALPPAPERRPLDPTLATMVARLNEIDDIDDLDQWWQMFRTAYMFVKKVKLPF